MSYLFQPSTVVDQFRPPSNVRKKLALDLTNHPYTLVSIGNGQGSRPSDKYNPFARVVLNTSSTEQHVRF